MALWQNFYFLVGSSASGLMGLMFVAVTFGAEIIRKENMEQVNTFIGSICFHFVQVLLFCCIASMPDVSSVLIAIVVAAGALWRLVEMPRVYRTVKKASTRPAQEIEKSDWLITLILPTVIYFFMIATSVAFYRGETYARDMFAFSIIALMMLAIRGAWEMIVWMATRIEKKGKPSL